jgi:hypothetical protein
VCHSLPCINPCVSEVSWPGRGDCGICCWRWLLLLVGYPVFEWDGIRFTLLQVLIIAALLFGIYAVSATTYPLLIALVRSAPRFSPGRRCALAEA